MNIITFRLHTQFNSIFPVVKIISEWLLLRAALYSLAGMRGMFRCVEERMRAKRGKGEERDDGGDTGG